MSIELVLSNITNAENLLNVFHKIPLINTHQYAA